MENLGSKMRRGAKWIMVNKVGSELIQFALGIVLARLLLPAQFGLVATVGIFTGLAGFFSGAGMGQALVRAPVAEKRHFDVVFTLQLMVGLGIYAGFFFLAPQFSRFFGDPLYASLLRVSAISFILRPFGNIPAAYLTREMHFRPLTLVNALTLFISGAATVALAVTGFGVWSLIAGGLLSGIVKGILLSIATRFRPRFMLDWEIAHDLGTYGLKVAGNSVLEYFRRQTPILLLSKLQGAGSVGLFNRAMGLTTAPMRIVGSSSYQVVFRTLATMQENRDKSKYVYYRTITLVAVYTLPFYVGLWWVAHPLIIAVYGQAWAAAAEPLRILVFAGILNCVGNPSGAVIEARNRLGSEININIAVWIWLVGATMIGVQWGLSGVAWAAVSATGVFVLSTAWVAAQEVAGSWTDMLKALRPPLLLNGLLFLALWGADRFWLYSDRTSSPGHYVILMVLIGSSVYTLAFLLLPISALAAEVGRWRTRVGLGRT
jgi:teichuronic acid exporter